MRLPNAIAATLAAALLIFAFFIAVFATVPRAHAAGCQSAVVSWYGSESGSKTASGMFYDGTQMLVAHKSLPFGTKIRFTHNGRSVTVPVQDRGPYIKGRVFDLSRAAAAELGIIGSGVARVCWEKVG